MYDTLANRLVDGALALVVLGGNAAAALIGF